MSARVSVRSLRTESDEADGDGVVTVAVKSATTAEEIERLAAEAVRIRWVSHPGVVTFVDHRTSDERAELHTLYVGTPLDQWSGGVTEVAGVLAALATTISELHDAGVVHGRLEASHVLMRPDGRPVLCSLSPPPDGTEPSDDVQSLGKLLRRLLADTARRTGRGRWRDLVEPAAPRRRLALAADRATDPVPERRPTARALARAVLDAVPDATLPDTEPRSENRRPGAPRSPGRDEDRTSAAATTRPEHGARRGAQGLFETAFVDLHDTGEHEVFDDRPWQETGSEVSQRTSPQRPPANDRKQHRLAVLAAVLACGALVGLGALWSVLRSARDGAGAEDSTAAGVGEAEHGDCLSEPGTEAMPPEPSFEVDVNGDGCPEPVVVTADGVVEAGDERWAVGDPGDIVTLGDWDCTGVATPALYRQATGDVFVFTEWADQGQPLRSEPVERVADGVSLTGSASLADGPTLTGCEVPVVELASGDHHPVEVPIP